MKKVFSIILILAIVLSLCSCGGKTTKDSGKDTSAPSDKTPLSSSSSSVSSKPVSSKPSSSKPSSSSNISSNSEPSSSSLVDNSSSSVSSTTNTDKKFYGDYEYVINSNNSVEIVKYLGSDTEVEIPGTIEGKLVQVLRFNSFAYNNTITSVSMPDSIIILKTHTFCGSKNLKNVKLSKNLKTIEQGAFWKTGIETIDLPAGLEHIGEEAFRDCDKLRSVVVPGSVKTIEKKAFQANTNLTSVTIEHGVTNIEDSAFFYTGYENIEIPATVKYIGAAALGSNNLKTVKFFGDAPEMKWFSGLTENTIVYYKKNASGWDTAPIRERCTMIAY